MLKARSGQPKHLSLDYKGGMKSGVYQIRNIANGKCYVGSSNNISQRWCVHKGRIKNKIHSRKLQNAFNKYGWENFEFHILEHCAPEERAQREQHWIDKLDSFKNGYNTRKTAESQLGFRHSEETRQKMKGRRHSEEARQKMSINRKGKPFSAEHKKNISEANKGRIPPNKGVPHSAETRKKLSTAMTPERRQDLIERNKQRKGFKHTEESKKKFRESWTEEQRNALVERNKQRKGYKHTDEARQKISDGWKRRREAKSKIT